MTIEEDLSSLEKKLKEETDVAIGIKELFKDSLAETKNLSQHDVDIRTRLIQKEISAMSVSNFLGTIKINGLKESKNLFKKNKTKEVAITEALSILMFHLKRHKISKEGKSRNEIIEILKGHMERKEGGGGFLKNIFTPNNPQ